MKKNFPVQIPEFLSKKESDMRQMNDIHARYRFRFSLPVGLN